MTLVALPYFGAKNRSSLQSEIINRFPIGFEKMHYIEPCVGSGAIFLNKKPSQIETLNDLDRDVVNFLEVLRLQPENLIRAITLTPWARSEFERANTPQLWLSDLEQARLFYVRVRMGFTGSPRIVSNGWRHCLRPEARSQNPAKYMRDAAERLWEVADRFLQAQLENRDALKIIQEYDGSHSLFYIDPPYILETRNGHKLSYTHEMSDKWHQELAKTLIDCRGKVILSGYKHGIYRRMEKHGWIRVDIEGVRAPSGKSRATRTESLWLNYEPPAQQLSLFGGAEA